MGTHPLDQGIKPACELWRGAGQGGGQSGRSLRAQEASAQTEPERLFKPSERIRWTEAPFAGIKGIYQMADSERRVMVLIELLSKQVRMRVAPANLSKVG